MAYYRRSNTGRRRTARAPARRSVRRSSTRSVRRVSGRPQTVRLVIEQAAPAVPRMAAASALIGTKPAPGPQKAKL